MHCYTWCPQPCSRPLPIHALLGTPGHFQASLDHSLVGSLLLSPGSWCTQCCVCACQEFISQSCSSSAGSMVGLVATSSRGLIPYPGLLCPEPQPLRQSTADPSLHRRHSDTVLSQSLLGPWVLVHTDLFEPSERFW